MVYSTKDIAETFKNYYEGLYSVEQKSWRKGEKTVKTNKFLEGARLPNIGQSEISMLDKPITEEEKPWPRRVYNALLQKV